MAVFYVSLCLLKRKDCQIAKYNDEDCRVHFSCLFLNSPSLHDHINSLDHRFYYYFHL